MRKQEKKTSRIWKLIKGHIYHNLKQYTIVSILFLIGIIVGVIFVNQSEIGTKEQIGSSINSLLDSLKSNYQIDYLELLKDVIGNHIFMTFLLWFMGCMVIGIPIVYGFVAFKGFSLGYTISSILFTLGTGKGSLFCILTLLLQNLLIIPSILALSVSGAKLYKSIMKDKRKENIKIEIIRHTIFSLLILCVLVISSFIEVYGSNFLLSICISWF